MKLIFLSLCIAIISSGCGAARFAADAAMNPIGTVVDVSGNIIGAGVVAGMPNQGIDYDD